MGLKNEEMRSSTSDDRTLSRIVAATVLVGELTTMLLLASGQVSTNQA